MNDRFKIIFSRALTNSGDQAWDFAVPVTLAILLPGQLDLVALIFFLTRLSHVLILPILGNLMDRTTRSTALRYGLAAQFLGVLIQLISFLNFSEQQNLTLIGIIIGGIIGGLGAAMTNISVAQDLVPLLFQENELTKINSRIRQVDLFSEICSPVIAGTILLLNSSSINLLGLIIIAFWNLISFFPEYILLSGILKKHQKKLIRISIINVQTPLFSKLSQGWSQLIKISSSPAIFAYAILWLSALSPHGVLLTSYLKESWQLPELTLGMFRSAGAIFGLLATVLFPIAVARLGLLRACHLSIIFQSLTLLFALVGFHLKYTYLFLGGVLLSRIGLYGYSLGEQQIRQTKIPENLRGAINATASAMTSLATLCLLGIGSVLGSVDQFHRLVDFSVFCVLIACMIFWKFRKSQKE